jgi:hypothetical protein
MMHQHPRTANQFQRACAKLDRLAPGARLSLSLTAGEGEGRSRTCHIFRCPYPTHIIGCRLALERNQAYKLPGLLSGGPEALGEVMDAFYTWRPVVRWRGVCVGVGIVYR